MMTSFSVSIADTVFTIVVEIIFLVQGKLFSMCVPINGVSKLINVFHMCLLNALYCFEYKWYNQGLELHKRLSSIETHWPYFLGNIDFFFFVKSKKNMKISFLQSNSTAQNNTLIFSPNLGFGLPLAIITSYPESQVVSGCVFSILFPLFLISGNQAQVVVTYQDVTMRIFNPTIALSNLIFSRTLAPSPNAT